MDMRVRIKNPRVFFSAVLSKSGFPHQALMARFSPLQTETLSYVASAYLGTTNADLDLRNAARLIAHPKRGSSRTHVKIVQFDFPAVQVKPFRDEMAFSMFPKKA